ncbi:SLC13 family permease [Exilibacterium tricleocarpae]|uniref:SLC13 family permease n=1 Tax=Exilibacterium tricleocarpae TaxID=2591008 RepID=A0A545U5F5_9GAMM|nr:SLC13 family permease [Exilibacterium tricleocarpae]TQV84705.1 SLC13 family permease [Exilibacterium tricleocarpae]
MMFSPDAWLTFATIALCFSLLVFSRLPADLVLVGGVALLLLLGVITAPEALAGLANEGMATVGVLFIVARGLVDTGVVGWIAQTLLGRPGSVAGAQLRLMAPVAALSTVLNNTPVVAMMVPAVENWAKRIGFSVSQLMIPLSYAAVVGGTCTLVGSSTNLVVNGMLIEATTGPGLSMFDLAWVGIPCVLVVMVFVVIASRWLLPNRTELQGSRFEDARQYILEMEVEEDSPLEGLSIEKAGLRQLPGVFLIEVERDGHLMTAVAPTEKLVAGDHLVFAGDVRSVVDLKNIHGLRVSEDQVFKLSESEYSRCLVEVVVSPNFPGLGKTVRDMGFRKHYGAVIIAMARGGERIKSRIGDMVLRPGDTLLLECHEEFVDQQSYSRDFLLVSRIENSEPLRHRRRLLAAAIMLAMVAAVAAGLTTMFEAAILAAGAMIVGRCLGVQAARRSIDWQVLLVIAAAIALGGALQKTGAAQTIAQSLIGLGGASPWLTLALLFTLTAGFSAIISNLAAAVLLFPVALSAAQQLGVDVTPFAVTLMVAASACFATPIGYQTNLMVYGPGGYRFVDFLKIGLPLTVAVGVVTVLLVPLVWPF